MSLALGAPESAGLAGARQELEMVAHDLPGCRLLIGNAATRSELLSQARQSHQIHLASHSYSNAADPLQGYLALADAPLTLPDIYGLHLDASPVMVLSSCCSALGQDAPDSEPISLATAFSSAGALGEARELSRKQHPQSRNWAAFVLNGCPD